MSYALNNIAKYKGRQRVELLKAVGTHTLELLTAVAILGLGIAILSLL